MGIKKPVGNATPVSDIYTGELFLNTHTLFEPGFKFFTQ